MCICITVTTSDCQCCNTAVNDHRHTD